MARQKKTLNSAIAQTSGINATQDATPTAPNATPNATPTAPNATLGGLSPKQATNSQLKSDRTALGASFGGVDFFTCVNVEAGKGKETVSNYRSMCGRLTLDVRRARQSAMDKHANKNPSEKFEPSQIDTSEYAEKLNYLFNSDAVFQHKLAVLEFCNSWLIPCIWEGKDLGLRIAWESCDNEALGKNLSELESLTSKSSFPQILTFMDDKDALASVNQRLDSSWGLSSDELTARKKADEEKAKKEEERKAIPPKDKETARIANLLKRKKLDARTREVLEVMQFALSEQFYALKAQLLERKKAEIQAQLDAEAQNKPQCTPTTVTAESLEKMAKEGHDATRQEEERRATAEENKANASK